MRTDAPRLGCSLAGLALALLGATGCSGDDGPDCGPGDAPPDGLTATIDGISVTFAGFTSSPNNDCTAGAVTSLTIEGQQVGASDRFVVLCVPSPDLIEDAPIALDDPTRIQVIDLFTALGECSAAIDRDRAITGTATFTGLCNDGTAAAGYALALDGDIPLTRTCAGVTDDVVASITGEVSVVSD